MFVAWVGTPVAVAGFGHQVSRVRRLSSRISIWRTGQVSLHFFAVRVEEHRVVAAEVTPAVAAELLDAAQPLLLGTAEELSKLAQRLRRPLVTIARAAPLQPSSPTRTIRKDLDGMRRSLAPSRHSSDLKRAVYSA